MNLIEMMRAEMAQARKYAAEGRLSALMEFYFRGRISALALAACTLEAFDLSKQMLAELVTISEEIA